MNRTSQARGFGRSEEKDNPRDPAVFLFRPQRNRWTFLAILCTGIIASGCEGRVNDGSTVGQEGGPCFSNGTCYTGLVCLSQLCVDPGSGSDIGGGDDTAGCIPVCGEKVCGPDGCGDVCGICAPTWECDATGHCILPGPCTPDCAGKECGANGCGATCGTCAESEGCVSGVCVQGENDCGDGECQPGEEGTCPQDCDACEDQCVIGQSTCTEPDGAPKPPSGSPSPVWNCVNGPGGCTTWTITKCNCGQQCQEGTAGWVVTSDWQVESVEMVADDWPDIEIKICVRDGGTTADYGDVGYCGVEISACWSAFSEWDSDCEDDSFWVDNLDPTGGAPGALICAQFSDDIAPSSYLVARVNSDDLFAKSNKANNVGSYGPTCACGSANTLNPDHYDCKGTEILLTCDNGCDWTEGSCQALCAAEGWDSLYCALDLNVGHEICVCE